MRAPPEHDSGSVFKERGKGLLLLPYSGCGMASSGGFGSGTRARRWRIGATPNCGRRSLLVPRRDLTKPRTRARCRALPGLRVPVRDPEGVAELGHKRPLIQPCPHMP